MRLRLNIQDNRYSVRQLLFSFGVIVLTYFIVVSNSISSTSARTMITALAVLIVDAVFFTNSFLRAINTKSFVSWLVFINLVFVFSLLTHGISTTIGAIISQVTYFCGMILFYSVMDRQDNKAIIRLIFWGVILVWLYEVIQLLLLCIASPNIGRIIASHGATYSVVSSVGSPYGIAQSTCLISIVILRFVTDKKYKIPFILRIIFVALLSVFTVTIYQTQSTITSLILVLGFTIVLIRNAVMGDYTRRNKGLVILVIMMLFGTFLFRFQIGLLLMSTFSSSNSVFGIRMVEIGRLLTGSTTSHDMQTRGQLFIQSWESIWIHPIFGNLYNGGSVSGDHCHVLDILSDYGFVMGIPNLLVFYYYIKTTKQTIRNYDLYAWVPMLVMSFLNPMRMFQVYFAILFIIPLCYIYFDSFSSEARYQY